MREKYFLDFFENPRNGNDLELRMLKIPDKVWEFLPAGRPAEKHQYLVSSGGFRDFFLKNFGGKLAHLCKRGVFCDHFGPWAPKQRSLMQTGRF